MAVFAAADDTAFQAFTDQAEAVIANISAHAREEDLDSLRELLANFRRKTEDFYRENRRLNIGVVGQVKAGKSSFLNTLLFNGQDVLPKASTPKTATLTKMEYAEENSIAIEYYSPEDWEVIAENAAIDLEGEVYASARELVSMVRRNGIEPRAYLEKGSERIGFASYTDLIEHLNDYVGEDGQYTPLVKAVTLYLNKEEFKGLSIVDTPGLNDPIASRTLRTKEFLELCDVVFFLSQSGSFLDKSDWVLLSSQLPQKGVKKLVLIASKYDSGIRDVLRVQDDDDIFGEDENTADNIPKACKLIRRKLKKRAKQKVEEFIKDLTARGSSPELIEVIGNCAEPIMVSALAYNMSGKPIADFSSEELNIYSALKQFSEDMDADLRLLGNFDTIKQQFAAIAEEKDNILRQKALSFVPNAQGELKELLEAFLDKTCKRLQLLEQNDRGQLEAQKKAVESQMNAVKADIGSLFGELSTRLETEKLTGIKAIREAGKEYQSVKERTGTVTRTGSYTVSDSKWYNPFSWGRRRVKYYTYQEQYSYCLAADAVENLNKYALEASSKLEEVFSEALQLKGLKRRVLNVVIGNFDLGSEKYDSSLFKIMVEENVNRLEFPVFSVNIEDSLSVITGRFSGELTSASDKNELSVALAKALTRVYEELAQKLEASVKQFKSDLSAMGQTLEDSLLGNILAEFDALLKQCADKDREIAAYQAYAGALRKELAQL
ncbi:MAG: dynamin family protein [bacterium]|nr:dynamin family protein [bacterium]